MTIGSAARLLFYGFVVIKATATLGPVNWLAFLGFAAVIFMAGATFQAAAAQAEAHTRCDEVCTTAQQVCERMLRQGVTFTEGKE